jgi:metal-responsive CopG/Arc/MetJ family transcriptional regulator|tara:strand:- start:882 stop:1118 length:237 start_codon:yes stop_codon:yes gene_type:complete
MTAIHVSIPVRLLEDFDETLSFTQSRSAKISALIKQALEGDMHTGVGEASTRQLMAALHARDDLEPWFSRVLLEILTK